MTLGGVPVNSLCMGGCGIWAGLQGSCLAAWHRAGPQLLSAHDHLNPKI